MMLFFAFLNIYAFHVSRYKSIFASLADLKIWCKEILDKVPLFDFCRLVFFFILLMYFKIGTGVKNEINRSKHNAKAQNWVNSR